MSLPGRNKRFGGSSSNSDISQHDTLLSFRLLFNGYQRWCLAADHNARSFVANNRLRHNSVIGNGLVEPFSNLTSVDLGVFASGATNPATVTFFESGVTRDQLAEKQSLDKMLRLKAGNGLQFHHYSDSSKTLPDDHWSQGTTQISTTGVAFNRLSPSKRVEKRQPHLDFT